MEERKVDEFAKAVIQHVRDGSIFDWLRILDGTDGSFLATDARNRIEGANSHSEAVMAALPDIVNTVLFYWMTLIESERQLKVEWQGVDVTTEAESLSGELWTEEGWIAKLSKQPLGKVE